MLTQTYHINNQRRQSEDFVTLALAFSAQKLQYKMSCANKSFVYRQSLCYWRDIHQTEALNATRNTSGGDGRLVTVGGSPLACILGYSSRQVSRAEVQAAAPSCRRIQGRAPWFRRRVVSMSWCSGTWVPSCQSNLQRRSIDTPCSHKRQSYHAT